MKKLLLCCAAALAAGLFQANSAEKDHAPLVPAASADYTIAERGVAGKQVGDDTYVFTLVLHMNGKFVVDVEPTPKVYRNDRLGHHEDVTAEVLIDYKIDLNKAEECINFSFGCRIGYESWSSGGSLYVLM